jgi:hypothetical protein
MSRNKEKGFDATATGVFISDTGPEPSNANNDIRKTYNLLVDDVPYIIRAKSFDFNGETRFYISVNGNPDHVFTWDSQIRRLRSIDDSASTIPDALEEAISYELYQLLK